MKTLDAQPPGYAADPTWRAIQQFLPTDMHLADEALPVEEYWAWHGHQVYLDRLERSSSPVTVILLHTVALDLPTYGQTRVARGARVTYDDWVGLVSDFIAAERQHSGRPVVLWRARGAGISRTATCSRR